MSLREHFTYQIDKNPKFGDSSREIGTWNIISGKVDWDSSYREYFHNLSTL